MFVLTLLFLPLASRGRHLGRARSDRVLALHFMPEEEYHYIRGFQAPLSDTATKDTVIALVRS